jgi:protein TonB
MLLVAEGPVYPEFARAQQIEGVVNVAYDITVTGSVVNVRVIKAVPTGVFDRAAADAVRGWKFLPMQQNGQSVAVADQISTLTFKLSVDQKDQVRAPKTIQGL